MHQIGNFLSEKATLKWLEFQIGFSKLVKNYTYVAETFLSSVQKDDFVIEVDEAVYQIELP